MRLREWDALAALEDVTTRPELPPGEIHLWRFPLALPPPRIEELRQILLPDERARADRFLVERARRQFTVARGLLRLILGRYLGEEPQRLRFAYGAHGKPALAPSSIPSDLRFNLSHSHELALLVVTSGRELGVDLEFMRPGVECLELATRFFTPAESAALRALPAQAQPPAFFTCWTRKEALLKATGKGLAIPLDQVDVGFHPEPPRLRVPLEGEMDPPVWVLRDLVVGQGYAGAVAVEEGSRSVSPHPPSGSS